MLQMPVIRSAEYKLPIIREICIFMLSLYMKNEVLNKIIIVVRLLNLGFSSTGIRINRVS